MPRPRRALYIFEEPSSLLGLALGCHLLHLVFGFRDPFSEGRTPWYQRAWMMAVVPWLATLPFMVLVNLWLERTGQFDLDWAMLDRHACSDLSGLLSGLGLSCLCGWNSDSVSDLIALPPGWIFWVICTPSYWQSQMGAWEGFWGCVA